MYSAIQPGFKTIVYFYLSSSNVKRVSFFAKKTISSSSICMQGSGSLKQLVLYPCKLPNYDYITGILNLSSLKKTNQLLHNISSFLPLTQLSPCLAAGLKQTDINNCLAIVHIHTGKREVSKNSKPPTLQSSYCLYFPIWETEAEIKIILENHMGSLLGFESRAWTSDISLSGTVISSSTSILFIQGFKAGMSTPWYSLANKIPLKTPCLCQLPGQAILRQSPVLAAAAGTCLTRWELSRKSCSPDGAQTSVVQQGEPSTKGQPLSGGVSSLIYVTCKLQPTAFCTMPRVSAENGIAHNCIVCLEGTEIRIKFNKICVILVSAVFQAHPFSEQKALWIHDQTFRAR